MDWNLGTAARTLWQESRGEPLEGQRAVAHVLMNRLRSGKWGLSFDEVCRSEYHGVYQFSGWSRHDPNRKIAARTPDDATVLIQLAALITAAGNEPDPTGGSTHYYNPQIIKTPPAWTEGATFCGQFGHQLFFKNVA